MFENKQFYHGTHRKIITAFGSLFNSIYIDRDADTKLKVPLKFAPTQSFLAKLNANNADEKIGATFPVMTFYIGDPAYDNERESDPFQTLCRPNATGGVDRFFQPRPFLFPIEMTIWTKYIEDKFKTLEQILPYFTPQFSLTVNGVDGVKEDYKLVFNGVATQDDWQGSLLEKRIIATTLQFDVEAYLYPEISEGRLINQVIVDITPDPDKQSFERNDIDVTPKPAFADGAFTVTDTWEFIEA